MMRKSFVTHYMYHYFYLRPGHALTECCSSQVIFVIKSLFLGNIPNVTIIFVEICRKIANTSHIALDKWTNFLNSLNIIKLLSLPGRPGHALN